MNRPDTVYPKPEKTQYKYGSQAYKYNLKYQQALENAEQAKKEGRGFYAESYKTEALRIKREAFELHGIHLN